MGRVHGDGKDASPRFHLGFTEAALGFVIAMIVGGLVYGPARRTD